MSRTGTRGGMILLLGAVALVLSVAIRQRSSDVEVEGRALNAWIDDAMAGSNDARGVLERLDPKHIPTFCRRAQVSPYQKTLERWAGKVPALSRFIPDRARFNERQAVILNALRINPDWGDHTAEILRTACAVPNQSIFGRAGEAAERLVTTASYRVRRDLEKYRTAGILEEFGSALTNRSSWVQYNAICTLGNFGQSASNWLPVLKKRYDSHGRTLAQHAARAVWRISGEREEPLAILLLGFTSKQHDVYNWTRYYLGEMASNSLPSIPVQKVLAEDNPEVPGRRKLPGLPAACGPGGPLAHRIIEQLQKSEDIELAEAAVEAARRLETVSAGK